MKFITLAVLAILSYSSALQAQQPTPVLFTPTQTAQIEAIASTDHSRIDLAGNPILVSYQVDAMAMNSVGAIAFSFNIGKPSVDPNTGKITAVVNGLVVGITRDTLYTATITSIGQAGFKGGTSAPTNPFGVVTGTPTAPAAATAPIIKKANQG